MITQKSVTVVLVAALLAFVVAQILQWIIWPIVFSVGIVDIQRLNGRMIFMAIGALPAVLAGYLAARYAPRLPLYHAIAAGCLLLLPLLFEIPILLRAYTQAAQPMWPLFVTIALRPLGAMGGAYLTGKVEA